ncbi:unnamed protein product [Periconia digitata]|uniref:Uncharacterized protein n=1 Tax=Periconia digitata TaxID=1303443 RepID=A0A9W4XQ96_9PLEO|nr:unnamed protein product [Periconia digitata]
MGSTKNVTPQAHAFPYKFYSFRVTMLTFPREGEIVHAVQRVRMVSSKFALASLHHLHKQQLRLFLSPLILKCRR